MRETGIFVVGTDTGVGKTVVAGMIAAAVRRQGWQVGVMKPVESGCRRENGRLLPTDALWLKEVSGCQASIDVINPYRLFAPLAPALAAEREGVRIDIQRITTCYRELARDHDLVVVESAGGLLSPLCASLTMKDLALALDIPTVVVAANVLGAISHTALTVQVARDAGLSVLGVALNQTGSERGLAEETNPEALRRWVPAPLLADLPFARDMSRDGLAAVGTQLCQGLGWDKKRATQQPEIQKGGGSLVNYQVLADKALAGEALARDECRAVLNAPDDEILDLLAAAYRVRRHHCGNRVHLHMLINAKSGLCPEDGHYCSQSKVSTADIERYPMAGLDRLLDGARRARDAQSRRYCIVISGRGPTDREVDYLAQAVSAIKAEMDIGVCCSVGLLDEDKARRLREAGVEQLNHNLNTSERFYPEICTTHTYGDRLTTLAAARRAGLSLCTGAIFGQGETEEDVIDVSLALRELDPQSIPVNFLLAIEGTPFEEMHSGLTPQRCLKILCLMRFLNPKQEIRVSAGREVHLRSLQPLALYAANSVFVSGYLTEPGQDYRETWKMIEDLGFEIERHQEPVAAG